MSEKDEDMELHSNRATFSGDNSGTQIGQQYNISNSRIEQHYHGPESQSQDQVFYGSYFHADLTRSPNFVVREAHRKFIEEQLHNEPDSRENKLLVICGFGGAGKTQLALDYLERNREKYRATFWIDASNTSSVQRDFSRICGLLFKNEAVPTDSNELRLRVKEGLQRGNVLCLLVFDGADTIEDRKDDSFVDLKLFLPRVPGVHVILTSRLTASTGFSALATLKIERMQKDEAFQLFQKCSGVHDQEETVRSIIQELGAYPLAVSIAGYYVAQDPVMMADLTQYVAENRQHREEILSWQPNELVDEYGSSVVSTWELSYEQIKRRSELAARLLTCLSFLNRTDITFNLFATQGASSDSSYNTNKTVLFSWRELLSPEAEVQYRTLKAAFALLVAYSLVDVTGSTYSTHELVHKWGIDRLSLSDRAKYSLGTTLALQEHIGKCTFDWKYREQLRPHVKANRRIFETSVVSLDQEQLERLDYMEPFYSLLLQGEDDSEVLAIAKFINSNCLSIYGEDDPQTLRAKYQLAMALHDFGDITEATNIMQEVIFKASRILGEDCRETLFYMITLVHFLKRTDDTSYDIAAMEIKLLDKCIQSFGENHLQITRLKFELASTLYKKGKIDEAITMCREVLGRLEGIHEPRNWFILAAKLALANFLSANNKHSEAQDILREAIDLHRRYVGQDHPHTIATMKKLITELRSGTPLEEPKLKEITALQREILVWNLKNRGLEHPDTVVAKAELAKTFLLLQQPEEAASLYRAVLEWRQKTLGVDHPDTITSMRALAIVLNELSRWDEAVTLNRAVLALYQENCGPDDHSTISVMSQLAHGLLFTNGQEEAVALSGAVLARHQKVLGADHQDTIRALGALGFAYFRGGRLEEAITISTEYLEWCSRVHGGDSFITFGAETRLANMLFLQGKTSEAIQLLRKTFEHHRRILGDDHPEIVGCAERLHVFEGL